MLADARLPLEAPDAHRRRETVAAMAAAVWRPEVAPETPAPVAPARRRLARISTAGSRVALGAGVGTLALFGSLTTASALSGTVAAAVHHTLGITLPLAHATPPAAPPAAPAEVAHPAAVGHAVPRPHHHPASGPEFVPPQSEPASAAVVPWAGAEGDHGRADHGRDDAVGSDGRHGHHSGTFDTPAQVGGADEGTPSAPTTPTTRPDRDDHQVRSGAVKSDDSTAPTNRYGPDGHTDHHRSHPSSTRTSTTKPTTRSSTTVHPRKAGWPITGTTHNTDQKLNP